MKKYFKNNFGKIFLILLFTFISVLMISIIPLTTKYIIEYYQDLDWTKMIILGCIYVLAIVLFLVFEYLKKIEYTLFQKSVLKELKNDLFNKVLVTNHELINKNASAYYQNLLTHDVEVIFDKYFNTVVLMIGSIITFIVYFAVMLFLDWILALAIVATCFLSLILPRIVGKKLKDLQEKSSKSEEEFLNKIDELINAKEFFSKETKNALFDNFEKKNLQLENDVYKLNKEYSKSDIFAGASLYLINVVAFLLGILFIYLKMSTVSNLVAIIAFIDSIAIPTRDIIYQIIVLKSTKKIRSKSDVVFKENEIKEKNISFNELILNDLTFRYEDGEEDIINKFSFKFEKGKKYAIVGKNGSGKSTLIKLISKELLNYTGDIKVNGIDLKELDFSSFGCYTSVDSFILDGSLKDNITLLDSYSYNVEKEINKLGISHLSGSSLASKSNNISSGEKSKIAVLRALNSSKELLIFDEIFANVDYSSEIEITNYLLSLDKTIIVITHNLDENNLLKFDEIIRL